jgi:hypothetical protein
MKRCTDPALTELTTHDWVYASSEHSVMAYFMNIPVNKNPTFTTSKAAAEVISNIIVTLGLFK